MYSTALITNTPIIIPKLNEKMMTKSEAIMATIISANSEIDSPKMTACFLIFL
jgi:hypothetical protein